MICNRLLAVPAILASLLCTPAFSSADTSEVLRFTSDRSTITEPVAQQSESTNCACSGACYCPTWEVEAGAIFLNRSKAHAAAVLRSDADPSLELVNTSDFDLGFSSGVKVRIDRNTCLGQLELLYFGIDGWSAQRSVDRFGDLYIVPNWGWGSEVFDQASAQYRSKLYNTEINFKRPLIGDIQWLAGFRWVELHESVSAQIDGTQSGTSWGNIDIRDINHMYGFQLGLDGTVWKPTDRLKIDGLLKAGIYHNQVTGSLSIAGSGGFDEFGSAEMTHTSFLGELGLFASYQMTDHLSVRGGYQALWLQGVMLAPEVITDSDSNSAFYHGPSVSLEAAW